MPSQQLSHRPDKKGDQLYEVKGRSEIIREQVDLSDQRTLTAEYRMLLGAMGRASGEARGIRGSRAGLLGRVVWLPVAHDGVHDVAELSRHRGDGDPVRLALASLLLVEGPEPRIVLPGAVRGQPQRPSQVRRAVLGYRGPLCGELPRLVDAGVQARVPDDRRSALEALDVAGLGDDLGSTRPSRAAISRSTFATVRFRNSTWGTMVLSWKDAASSPGLMPTDDFAAALPERGRLPDSLTRSPALNNQCRQPRPPESALHPKAFDKRL